MMEQDDPPPITTYEEYVTITTRLESLEDRADKIANILCSRRASVTKFTADCVYYHYNGSCNCHVEDYEDSFPAEYLFDPTFEDKHNAKLARAAREKEVKMQEEAELKRQEQERADRARYVLLKAKYDK